MFLHFTKAISGADIGLAIKIGESIYRTAWNAKLPNHRLNPLRFSYGNERSIEFLNDNTHYLSKYYYNSQQGQTGYSSLAISRGKFSKASNSDGLITYPIPNQGEYNEKQELLVYKDLSDMSIEPVVFTAGKGFKQLEAIDINGDGIDVPVKINYINEKNFIHTRGYTESNHL